MKRTLALLLMFCLGAGAAWRALQHTSSAAEGPLPEVPPVRWVAAPGRVEPVSEEVKVGSALGGKVLRVTVEEGDRVRAGQTLAQLENDDFAARVVAAEASVAQAEALLRRVTNGSRDEERREARAAIVEAEAVLDNAAAERDRRRALFESGDVSRSEMERAEREWSVAQARLKAAEERFAFVDADAREEDTARATADVALARARLAEARALYAKTFIRSPVNGVVLRRHVRAGEALADGSEAPLFTMGDDRVLRVRAEIDESDIARVTPGQSARIRADAYGEREFTGRVVRVGPLVGKKNVFTERPSERVDTKVLDALIELDPGQVLPAGLRVDVFIG
ncbi:MAG: efflux RND transporter periplasmic adaptor subunit [Bryobacterales bacterium]|nr:efflux RND transporter periplasmic adaptor subunit [Bryobacterales bacterium]